MGYVVEFIKHISKRSQIVAHQLIWNMQTNMYIDEEMHHKDRKFSELISLFRYRSSLLIFFISFASAVLYDGLEALSQNIIASLSGPAKRFYEREFDFFGKITG